MIHNCAKDIRGFEPSLKAACNFSFGISSEAFAFNQVANVLFVLQKLVFRVSRPGRIRVLQISGGELLVCNSGDPCGV